MLFLVFESRKHSLIYFFRKELSHRFPFRNHLFHILSTFKMRIVNVLDQGFSGFQPVTVGYMVEEQQKLFRTRLDLLIHGSVRFMVLLRVSGSPELRSTPIPI